MSSPEAPGLPVGAPVATPLPRPRPRGGVLEGRHCRLVPPDPSQATALFAAYDRDDGANWTYLPQGLGYARSRHTPNVSSLVAVGVAADGRFAEGADEPGLAYKAEVDVLFGRDDVDNADQVVADPFDGGDTTQIDKKVRGLLYILAQHPEYHLR